MNSVVLKGKLGAGFNDDRYTLPKDGNPGDILVKTETGSAWEKQEPAASGGRVFVTGTIAKVDGGMYIATNETQDQINEMYIGGKDVVLEMVTGDNPTRFSYNGNLFYAISALSTSNTIDKVGLMVAGEPILENTGERRTLWCIGSFSIAN